MPSLTNEWTNPIVVSDKIVLDAGKTIKVSDKVLQDFIDAGGDLFTDAGHVKVDGGKAPDRTDPATKPKRKEPVKVRVAKRKKVVAKAKAKPESEKPQEG